MSSNDSGKSIASRESNQGVNVARQSAWIRELLDLPGTEEIEFEPPRMGDGVFLPADLG